MIFQRLLGPKPAKAAGQRLYAAAVSQARTPALYADLGAPDTASATRFEDQRPSYWLRQQEGWFWYRDPPPAPTPPAPAAQEKDRRPQELIEFEAMQKRLEELKKVAVMNPSDANMKAYMGYQRFVMDKSASFCLSSPTGLTAIKDLMRSAIGASEMGTDFPSMLAVKTFALSRCGAMVASMASSSARSVRAFHDRFAINLFI